ncbi:hypothetical protein SAZ11_07470 [Streptomyces sp. FXJ1.4098]|nr:hypothetical protein [Streptomyces sp. FXJ1.4098]
MRGGVGGGVDPIADGAVAVEEEGGHGAGADLVSAGFGGDEPAQVVECDPVGDGGASGHVVGLGGLDTGHCLRKCREHKEREQDRVEDGHHRGCGGEGGEGGREILGLGEEILGHVGASVCGLSAVAESGVVVGSQFGPHGCREHVHLCLACDPWGETAGDVGGHDAQESAQASGASEERDGGRGLPQAVLDVAAGDQGGDGAGDGQQAEGFEESGEHLAGQQGDDQSGADAPCEGERLADELRQACSHRLRSEGVFLEGAECRRAVPQFLLRFFGCFDLRVRGIGRSQLHSSYVGLRSDRRCPGQRGERRDRTHVFKTKLLPWHLAVADTRTPELRGSGPLPVWPKR